MIQVADAYVDKYVCVLGQGYVGLTLAATMAEVGFKVLGVEIRDDVLNQLRQGRSHFYEPGLDDLLERLTARRGLDPQTGKRQSHRYRDRAVHRLYLPESGLFLQFQRRVVRFL